MMRVNRIRIGLVCAMLVALALLLPGAGPGQAQTVLAKANAEQAPDVRIEVTELKRTSGNTLTLKAVIVNESDKTFNPAATHTTYLLNTTNKLKHTVVRDERGNWICSKASNVKAKSRAEIWAKFGAPPEGVQKLTVVIPKFSPLEDVPVSQ